MTYKGHVPKCPAALAGVNDGKTTGAAQILKLQGVRLKLRSLECRSTTEL